IKNTSKNALNSLSRNKTNLTEIIHDNQINQITNELRKELEGNEEEIKLIQINQEGKCNLLIAIQEYREDDELRRQIIECGIVDALLHIFLTRSLESITLAYINAFFQLTLTCKEIKQQIYLKNPYPALIRLLDHPDKEIVNTAVVSIFNIQLCGLDTTSSTEQHPHYEEIAVNEGIEKIFNLFQMNVSKFSKDRAAICLGRFFRCYEITNELMRREIINHLITLLTDKDSRIKNTSKNALNSLSRNKSIRQFKQ
ncbi:MAG: hypothetical protein EZS28_052102, partial [Streblomastix strix]